MLIENEFPVSAPIDDLWAYLLDVEKIAPCMPGAELTEVIDDRNWKGRMKMKFGPVAMAFVGTVSMVERDDDEHRVALKAQGVESRGKGAASAKVTTWLEPGDDATTVRMQADITLQGLVAQVSRGMLPDISARLTQQFADCLQSSMMSAQSGSPAVGAPTGADRLGRPSASDVGDATPAPAQTRARAPAPEASISKPVGGLSLGLWAVFRAIARGIGRLFGRTYDD